MANLNKANGFRAAEFGANPEHEWVLAASQTIAVGDLVTFDAAGRVIIATASSAKILGSANTPCTSSTVGDAIKVFDDPDQIFVAQISTGALTDPYTTMTLSTAFDIVATTGGLYINAAATSIDIIQVLHPATEPATGVDSVVGAYQKVHCRINRAKHCLGGVA